MAGLTARALFLAVPLALIGMAAMRRLPPAWRVVAGLGAGLGVGFALAALAPPGLLAYLVSFAVMGSIFAVLSIGLNVQWGYTGLFNIGVAAFFAVGAFTAALVTSAMPTGPLAAYSRQAFGLQAPFLVGIAAAALVSALLAALMGLLTLRLQQDYLAIATIGIAEFVRLLFQNERWLANGPQPLRGIPRPLFCLVQEPPCPWLPAPLRALLAPLEPRDYPYIYLALVTVMLTLVYLLLEQAIRSPWGRVLRAIREEETSAAMSGKDVFAFKMQALVVGAVIMGVGGALYAHYLTAIDYGHFTPLYGTFLIWVMLMLGGSGNNRGAILGAFLIWGVWTGTTFLTDALGPALGAISPDLPARAPYVRYLMVAALLELIVLFRPQGLLGEARQVSRLLQP